jgi:hypothetical protein
VWVHSFINLSLVWENIMMWSCLLARTCHRKVWIPLECVSLTFLPSLKNMSLVWEFIMMMFLSACNIFSIERSGCS